MLDRLGLVVAAALVGWCLGWLVAWLTNWLQRQDDLPSTARGVLIQDVFVQSAAALVWAAAALVFDDWPRWVAVALLAVPLIQVTVTDLRHRYVYTVVAAIGLLLGLGLGWLAHAADLVQGVRDSALGALGGFVAFAVLYLLGRLLYRGGEPLARGDMTIAAMVGAQAGACTASALFLGVILGGLLALGVLLRGGSRRDFMAYGPGLCVGGLVSLFRC